MQEPGPADTEAVNLDELPEDPGAARDLLMAELEKVRAAYAHIDDVSIVAHPGAVHGFSHDGPGFDAKACRAGLDAGAEGLSSWG